MLKRPAKCWSMSKCPNKISYILHYRCRQTSPAVRVLNATGDQMRSVAKWSQHLIACSWYWRNATASCGRLQVREIAGSPSIASRLLAPLKTIASIRLMRPRAIGTQDVLASICGSINAVASNRHRRLGARWCYPVPNAIVIRPAYWWSFISSIVYHCFCRQSCVHLKIYMVWGSL